MNDLLKNLYGQWRHAFEDDSEGVTVYRPINFEFPPARGRAGIEFRPDGTFIDHAIGRGDGANPTTGHWHMLDQRRFQITLDGKAPKNLEILDANDQKIQVRWHEPATKPRSSS
jgi:hypothetical protein